ncbi:MAG: hypothetical protein RLN89_03495 [Parvibaculum sp.]
MSLSVIVNVLHKSKSKGNMRLCLIAIAENASDEGVAWPGIELIRKKMGGVAPETARKAMRDAVDAGELEIAWGGGPRATNVYWVRSGLDAEATCPEEFMDALMLSAQRQAAGKVIIPDRYRDAQQAECDADASEEEPVDNLPTPPETGGVENSFHPSSYDADPSSPLEGDPSSCLDPNRHRTLKNPARADGAADRYVQCRGVEVRADGAELFERVAVELVRRHGEPWWAAWMAFSRWEPGDEWLVTVRSTLVANRIRTIAGDQLQQLLGRKIVFEVDARRALAKAPPSDEVEASNRRQTRKRKGRRQA